MQRSKKYSISYRDILHGFLTAFLSASITGLMETLSQGVLPDLEHIKTHALIGLSAGIAYLFKKFMTNSEGKILSKEPKNTIQ